MSILNKIKSFFKSDMENNNNIPLQDYDNSISFLEDTNYRFALYFQASNGNYVLVGDENYPYSKNDLDVEWISMNKHNFKYYEEFESFSQLLDRYKEIEQEFTEPKLQQEDIFEYEEYNVREEKAKSLPAGWFWTIYDDASGHLNSPTGKEYFSYDWTTKEYKITENDEYYCLGYYETFGEMVSFNEFQRLAENYAKKNLVNLDENIKEVSVKEKIDKAVQQYGKHEKTVSSDKLKVENLQL